MKMNIEITKLGTGFLGQDEKIVDIDICNGNWKYWDNMMETEEKTSLTINSINQSAYLNYPVKDAYPIHDYDKAVEMELIVTDAMVRTYDSLLSYLNCRIDNQKESFKKYGWTERTYTINLFDEKYSKVTGNDITGDIVYEQETLIEVKITVVE